TAHHGGESVEQRSDGLSRSSGHGGSLPEIARSFVLDSRTYYLSCYLVKVVLSAEKEREPARRRPRADGERTRGAILRAAASLATVDGLGGLSVGKLGGGVGVGKTGPEAPVCS